jgi:hypothetical protein
MDRNVYQRQRDDWTIELRGLQGAEDQSVVLEQIASFLTDLPAAWAIANQEQRNRLARTLFERVLICDNQVIGMIEKPKFAPFFELDNLERIEAEIETGAHWAPVITT